LSSAAAGSSSDAAAAAATAAGVTSTSAKQASTNSAVDGYTSSGSGAAVLDERTSASKVPCPRLFGASFSPSGMLVVFSGSTTLRTLLPRGHADVSTTAAVTAAAAVTGVSSDGAANDQQQQQQEQRPRTYSKLLTCVATWHSDGGASPRPDTELFLHTRHSGYSNGYASSSGDSDGAHTDNDDDLYASYYDTPPPPLNAVPQLQQQQRSSFAAGSISMKRERSRDSSVCSLSASAAASATATATATGAGAGGVGGSRGVDVEQALAMPWEPRAGLVLLVDMSQVSCKLLCLQFTACYVATCGSMHYTRPLMCCKPHCTQVADTATCAVSSNSYWTSTVIRSESPPTSASVESCTLDCTCVHVRSYCACTAYTHVLHRLCLAVQR
jgi:hypothetical protein